MADGILPFSRRQLPEGVIFAGDVVGPNSWRFDQQPVEAANSSRTFFTLAEPYQDNKILVFKNGIKLISGQEVIFHPPNVIEFPVAPVTGAKIETWYLVPNVPEVSIWVVDETVAGARNGTNRDFTTTYPYVSGKLILFRNGVKQIKGLSADYVEINSTSFRFNVAPPTGTFIEASYLIQA